MEYQEFNRQFNILHKELHKADCSIDAEDELATLVHVQAEKYLRLGSYHSLNLQDKEDLAQTVTMAILKKCREVQPETINYPDAYITNATRNHALNYIKTAKLAFPNLFLWGKIIHRMILQIILQITDQVLCQKMR